MGDPMRPSVDATLVHPEDPVDPEDPEDPMDPDDPVDPDDPADPTNPAYLVDPMTPVDPVNTPDNPDATTADDTGREQQMQIQQQRYTNGFNKYGKQSKTRKYSPAS